MAPLPVPAWKTPWTAEAGRCSPWSQRVGHDGAANFLKSPSSEKVPLGLNFCSVSNKVKAFYGERSERSSFPPALGQLSEAQL